MKEKTAENFANIVAGTTAAGVMETVVTAARALFGGAAPVAAAGTGVAAASGTAVAGSAVAAALTPAALTGAAVCGIALFAWSYLGIKSSAETEKRFQERFRQLLDEQGSLKRLLQKLSLGQIELELGQEFAAQEISARSSELLKFIETAEQDRRVAADEHRELLIYIGEQAEKRFDATSQEIVALKQAGEAMFSELRSRIASSATEQREDSQKIQNSLNGQGDQLNELLTGNATLRQLVQQVLKNTSTTQRSEKELQNEIDEAVKDCNSGDFGGGRKLFQKLKEKHWNELTIRQMFRVLVNLAIIAEQFEHNFQLASEQFVAAADLDPDHEEAEAVRALGLLYRQQKQDARTFAERAISKSPNNEMAWAAWLHTREDEQYLEAILALIPNDQQHRPNTAYNIGLLCQARRQFEMAIAFHRIADAGSGHSFAGLQLALSLINFRRFQFGMSLGGYDDAARGDLEEGIRRLAEHLDRRLPDTDAVDRARIHQMKGLALELLGRDEDARVEYELATRSDPQNSEVAAQRAMALADGSGLNRAIDELRPHVTDSSPNTELLVFVHLLQRRGSSTDHREVVVLIEASLKHRMPRDSIAELLRHFITSAAKLGDWQAIERLTPMFWNQVTPSEAAMQKFYIAALKEDADPSIRSESAEELEAPGSLHQLSSQLLELSQKVDEAMVTEFGEREPLSLTSHELPFLFWAARTLTKYGASRPAFTIYRKVLSSAPPDHPLIPDMLVAAQSVGDDLFLREQCARLLRVGCLDWRIIVLAADLEFHYGDFAKAVDILDAQIANASNARTKKILRLKLASMAIVTGDKSRLVIPDDQTLADDEVPLSLAAQHVHVLLANQQARKAFDFVSTLLKRHRDNPRVHDILITTVIGIRLPTQQFEVVGPTTVSNGCSFRYSVDGKDGVWVVVEDDNPVRHEQEQSTSSPLVKILLGKEVGHTFTIDDPLLPKACKIEFIGHRAFGMAALAIEDYLSRFPGREPIVRMVDVGGANGDVDAKKAVDVLTRASKPQVQTHKDAFANRRKHQLPVCVLGRGLNLSDLRVIACIAASSTDGLQFCRGTSEERETAQQTLANAGELVLSPDAAAILYLAGIHKAGPLKFLKPLLVTQRLIVSLERDAEKFRDDAASSAHVAWDNGVRIIEHDEAFKAAHLKEAESLDSFIAWLKANATSVDAWDLAAIPTPLRRILLEAFSLPALEAVAIAHANKSRVLLSDDHALQSILVNDIPLKRVWSQIVFPTIENDESAEGNFGHDLAAWLCSARFGFTRITPSAVIRQLNKFAWDANNPAVDHLLICQLETGASFESYIFRMHRLLLQILRKAPTFDQAVAVGGRLLDHVADHPFGIQIIEGVAFNWSRDTNVPVQIKLVMNLVVERWRARMLRLFSLAGIVPGDPLVKFARKSRQERKRNR